MTTRTYECLNCGTVYLDATGAGRACHAHPSSQDDGLRTQIAQLAGRRNVYDQSKSNHIESIAAALDRLDAVRDYIEDSEPDDWQVAYERLSQIIDAKGPTE
jgi:predicted ATP-dependent serine protease